MLIPPTIQRTGNSSSVSSVVAMTSTCITLAVLWPKLLQHTSQRENLSTDILSEHVEFRFKLIGNLNGPFHAHIMA